jgi:hypothetical protein
MYILQEEDEQDEDEDEAYNVPWKSDDWSQSLAKFSVTYFVLTTPLHVVWPPTNLVEEVVMARWTQLLGEETKLKCILVNCSYGDDGARVDDFEDDVSNAFGGNGAHYLWIYSHKIWCAHCGSIYSDMGDSRHTYFSDDPFSYKERWILIDEDQERRRIWWNLQWEF